MNWSSGRFPQRDDEGRLSREHRVDDGRTISHSSRAQRRSRDGRRIEAGLWRDDAGAAKRALPLARLSVSMRYAPDVQRSTRFGTMSLCRAQTERANGNSSQ